MKRFLSEWKLVKKTILLWLVFLLATSLTHFSEAAVVKVNVSLFIPTTSQDLKNISSNIQTKYEIFQKRISSVNLLSSSFSPNLNFNLESRIRKNETAVSFAQEQTKKEIQNISSKINLVKIDRKDLFQSITPYSQILSSKIKDRILDKAKKDEITKAETVLLRQHRVLDNLPLLLQAQSHNKSLENIFICPTPSVGQILVNF